MIKCDILFEKKTIDSYYEFLFAMALAAECGRRGLSLDMSMMCLLDKGMLSKDDLDYMHFLRDKGYIYDNSNPETRDKYKSYDLPTYYFDVDSVTNLYFVLFRDDSEYYYWDRKYAEKNYSKDYIISILNIRRLGNSLIHLVAHMLMCFKMHEREEKPMKFYFATTDVNTDSLYLNLWACHLTIPSLKKLIFIEFDENYVRSLGDMDFSILYNTSKHANRFKKWSCSDKFEAFRQYGFQKGDIAILYRRSRFSKNNQLGKIATASVIRINDFSEDLKSKPGWYVSSYAIKSTLEERLQEYYLTDESIRDIIFDGKLHSITEYLNFNNVGIGSYFYDEDYLLLPIEKNNTRLNLVIIDGKYSMVEMDNVDTIYWILNEYQVDFDKDMYRNHYNNGKPLMWDIYGDLSNYK